VSTDPLERLLVESIRKAYSEPNRALFPIARRHLVDCAGVALAGIETTAVRNLISKVSATATRDSGRLLGSGQRVSMRDAALINGMAGHYHDYDDDDPALAVGHPTVPVFAALLAVADATAATIDEALAAYVVGVEATMRMGRIVNPRHYDAGFHATATLGVFGAAAAAAMLLRADEAAVGHALGLAASLASGLKGNFGSDAKSLQVGAAAANAVFAAVLGAAGVQSAPGAVLGRAGFCAMHGGTDPAPVVEAYGRPWGLEEPGLNVKLYSCCSSTHTAVDGLLGILDEGRLAWSDVDSIEAWIGPDVPSILMYDVPDNPLQAKFSLRYCLAAAAVFGRLGLDEFEFTAFSDTRVRALIERTTVHVDPTLPRIPTGATHASRVRVGAGGTSMEKQVDDPLGSAKRPMPDEVLRRKFIRCATRSIGERGAERSFDAWMEAQGHRPLSVWLDTLCSKSDR